MPRLLLIVFIVTALVFSKPEAVRAFDKTAGASASLLRVHAGTDISFIELSIQRVLNRYDSPLAEKANYFVRVATQNKLNPYMLPSIAGVESGFGRALMPGSHNPFGWGGGYIYFDSWEEGILTVGEGLHTDYFRRGAGIQDIGPMYAGGSHTWAPKVLAYMRAFENEEARIRRLYVL